MRPHIVLLTSVTLGVLGGSGGAALAAGSLDLSWFTIDGGGGTSTGGGLALSGTIGQPDAGAASGGAFVLAGGFWSGGEPGILSAPDSPTGPNGPGEPGAPAAPLVFRAHPAHPNPFGRGTALGVDLPGPGEVRMDVYDVRGRHVRGLIDTQLEAGHHAVSWDGRSDAGVALASGAYFVRVVSPHGTSVQQVMRLE